MITFTKDMEVGVDKIDSQHKELIERLNAVIAMGVGAVSKAETDKTFNMLNTYVAKHFSEEEELQRKSNFPKYEWHKEQHKAYIKGLEDLKKEYDTNGHSAKFTLDLNNSIIRWIVRHIKSADIELGAYLKSQ